MCVNLATLKHEIAKNLHNEDINKAVAARVIYELKGGQDKTILEQKINTSRNVYTRMLLKSVELVEKARKEVVIGYWTAESYTKAIESYLLWVLNQVYRNVEVSSNLTGSKMGNITNHTSIFIKYQGNVCEVPFSFKGRKAEGLVAGLEEGTQLLLFVLMTKVGIDIEKSLTMLEIRDLDSYIGTLL